MTTNTEFIIPKEYVDLIREVQEIASWASEDIAWKAVTKIYEITTDFLEKEDLLIKEK